MLVAVGAVILVLMAVLVGLVEVDLGHILVLIMEFRAQRILAGVLAG